MEFRYERLTTFCFICGCLGHTDRKCSKIFDHPDGVVVKPYGPWMKASNGRSPISGAERWFQTGPVAGREEEELGSTVVSMKVDMSIIMQVGDNGGNSFNGQAITTTTARVTSKDKGWLMEVGLP